MSQRASALGLLVLLASSLSTGAGLAAQRPAPVDQPATLTLRIAGDRRQFRPGEIIPVELTFKSAVPKRFVVDGATYDRSGRLTIDQYSVEPIGAVTDPMLDYYAAGAGFIGGGLRGMGTLGEKPYSVTLSLNEWFRFDRPGTYRLSVRSSRVRDEVLSTPNAPAITIVDSNIVSFDILPRDTAWETEEAARALRILNAPSAGGDRRTGCEILRFLANNAAVDAMVRH